MPKRLKRSYRYFKLNQGDSGLWWCRNKKSGELLATVGWYEPWKMWTMDGFDNITWSSSCLKDMTDFLDQLNADPDRWVKNA